MLPRTVLKEVIKAANETAELLEATGNAELSFAFSEFASRLFYNTQVPFNSLSERQ